MKNTICVILFSVMSVLRLHAGNENDSLLRVLDRVISDAEQHTLDEQYQLNAQIISQYETFICDSAEQYIHKNIKNAEERGNMENWMESRLHLAFVYSLSELFVPAIMMHGLPRAMSRVSISLGCTTGLAVPTRHRRLSTGC